VGGWVQSIMSHSSLPLSSGTLIVIKSIIMMILCLCFHICLLYVTHFAHTFPLPMLRTKLNLYP